MICVVRGRGKAYLDVVEQIDMKQMIELLLGPISL